MFQLQRGIDLKRLLRSLVLLMTIVEFILAIIGAVLCRKAGACKKPRSQNQVIRVDSIEYQHFI